MTEYQNGRIKMPECTVRIARPDDSRIMDETTIRCDTHSFGTTRSISIQRGKKDPVHAGLEDFWRGIISPRNRYSRGFGYKFNHVVMIKTCPVVLSREGIRYQLNGKSYSLATICSALARLTFKSCFEDNPEVLLSSLYSTLSLPENVRYCLENRAPYHFRHDYEKVEVRLNVVQIDDNMLAMEISDGVWGEITPRQLDTFCNFYHLGKARGSWKKLGPKYLFKKLIGREPTTAEKKVMRAFLMQNRTQDMVEERALQLVKDLCKQHDGRIHAVYDELGVLTTMYVRGRGYDWKLTNNRYKTGIQMVSTYIWQPKKDVVAEFAEQNWMLGNISEVEGTKYFNITEDNKEDFKFWSGPICIDNVANNSPLGDQFAGRALALLNDLITVKMVSTIRGYMTHDANKYRIEGNEINLRRMQKPKQ